MSDAATAPSISWDDLSDEEVMSLPRATAVDARRLIMEARRLALVSHLLPAAIVNEVTCTMARMAKACEQGAPHD